MYESIVLTIVALSLLVTLAFEIADSVIDRRRIAVHAGANQARPSAVAVAARPAPMPVSVSPFREAA